MHPRLLLSFASLSAIGVFAQKIDHPDSIQVGFNLQDTYGTVAISYPNGTLVGIGRANGGDGYRKLMEKYSDSSNMHLAPPYQKFGESWSDMPRQQWRKFRKWLGFPASAEVGIVSALLRDLKDVAEDVLGFEVTSGGASVPWYPAVYDEDIGDAFDYLGVEYLQIIWYKFLRTYLTYDDMVALAGHNLALCSDIKNASTCWDGSLRDNYFIVHYSKHEIRMDLIITYNMGAYDFYPSTRRIPELGSDHIGDAYYWLSLRYQLLMWEYLLAVYRPSAIILTGESVQEPGFRQCVLESMIEMFGIAVPPILDDDPEYVQAKGVAELLRRRRYLPEPTRPSSARTGLRGVDKPSEGQVPLDL